MTNIEDRLKAQLNFLYEIDKLKTILRRSNLIADPTRFENSAEHSWHIAFYALILAEYSDSKINLAHVVKMVLLHDVVEIDAGDTFLYDEQGNLEKYKKEQLAAERLFGLLPQDQGEELMLLWKEFETGETPEAKFAKTMDGLQPVLHNYVTGGGSWKRHAITRKQVDKCKSSIESGSVTLDELMKLVLDDAVKNNFLAE